ncbi:unnamed protein product [Linum tenue]|uniref:Uncharacterized protein n=1 Tax=Linum tenue TaxID=586396 RepID=A0AAV0IUQ5_9ROSI|nr:unnamed protein product [Linum tenue]
MAKYCSSLLLLGLSLSALLVVAFGAGDGETKIRTYELEKEGRCLSRSPTMAPI